MDNNESDSHSDEVHRHPEKELLPVKDEPGARKGSNVDYTRPSLCEGSDLSGASTETLRSRPSRSPPPFTFVHDAVAAGNEQLRKVWRKRRPRDAIQCFVDWQLQSVSEQSADYRNYHAYLKRRIRKKASRDAARETREEDALRMARLAPLVDDESENDHEVEDCLWEEDFVTKDFMRLPLESYLPRRVTQCTDIVEPKDIKRDLDMLADLLPCNSEAK